MRIGSTTLLLLVIMLLVSLSTTFITGDACNHVPSMKRDEACRKACDTPAWYNLCQETLQAAAAPDVAEVSVYANVAARFAGQSYHDTLLTADHLLANGSIPADQQPAYKNCVDRYSTASIQMARVVTETFSCEFGRLEQRYLEVVDAMASCGEGLDVSGTPLVAMSRADKDWTMIAYGLGALILGK